MPTASPLSRSRTRGQRGEIELGPHHFEEFGVQLRFERGSEQAEVGFV
jgi:hypothetical protein